jgi:hypothetical protein
MGMPGGEGEALARELVQQIAVLSQQVERLTKAMLLNAQATLAAGGHQTRGGPVGMGAVDLASSIASLLRKIV